MTTPRRPQVEVQDQPKVKNLLEDLQVAPEIPVLTEAPVLTEPPTLREAPTLTEAPILQVQAGPPKLIPFLQDTTRPARVGAPKFALSERLRRKLIHNVVVVQPPPLPPDPPKMQWWLPAHRYRSPLESDHFQADMLLKRGTLVDFDACLTAKVERQRSAMSTEWRADLAPSIWATGVTDERKALVGYPDGYPDTLDEDIYPPELFKVVAERYCDLRETLWKEPWRFTRMPDTRYALLEHISEWWGHKLSWADIYSSHDGDRITSPYAAAVDYVCWREPQLTDTTCGKELRKLLDRCDRFAEEKHPVDNMFFPYHHEGVIIEESASGRRIGLRGGFLPAQADDGSPLIVYVSAAGMFGEKFPRGVVGWRQVTMMPVPQYPPRHVCRVDCPDWQCIHYDEPLFDDPDDYYGPCNGGAC